MSPSDSMVTIPKPVIIKLLGFSRTSVITIRASKSYHVQKFGQNPCLKEKQVAKFCLME